MLNFRASESLVVLYLQNNEAGIRRQYHEYSDCSKDPKNPHLNQADLQKKSLENLRHLKCGVFFLGKGLVILGFRYMLIYNKLCNK